MKLVERNPIQLVMNEKSLVELLRIYGKFIELVMKNPRKDLQWLLEEKWNHVQQKCNDRFLRDAGNLCRKPSAKSPCEMEGLMGGKYSDRFYPANV